MTHENTTTAPAWYLQATRPNTGPDDRPLRTVARSRCDEIALRNEATGNRYYSELDRFFTWAENLGLDINTLGRDQVVGWVHYMRNPHWDEHPGACITDCKHLKDKGAYATRTIKRRLAIVSGFYDYAVAEGRLDRNPARKIDLGKVTQEFNTLRPQQLEDLFDAALRTHPHILPARKAINFRNGALIALLAGVGLRREEAVSLRIENLGEDLAGRPTIAFTRKGGLPAVLPVSKVVHTALLDAIDDRESGPILISGSRYRGRTPGLALGSVDQIVTDLGARIGLQPHEIWPHLGRKTCVTLALTLPEVSPEQAMQYFGHTNFRTTTGYDAFRQVIFKDITENPLQPRSFWQGLDLAA